MRQRQPGQRQKARPGFQLLFLRLFDDERAAVGQPQQHAQYGDRRDARVQARNAQHRRERHRDGAGNAGAFHDVQRHQQRQDDEVGERQRHGGAAHPGPYAAGLLAGQRG